LRLYGLMVDQVVVNRVFPDAASPDPQASAADSNALGQESNHTAWLAGWNQAQQRGLSEVRHSFDPLPIVIAPYLSHEPVGPDALATLARACTGAIGDVLTSAPAQGMTVRQEGRGYLLMLPLPLVTAAQVNLKRRDDELLVAVADHRRVLSLPSILRRCVVTGAVVHDATLRVRFVPDKKLWPVDDAESVAPE
jgi:arsenite-transporting ATPase